MLKKGFSKREKKIKEDLKQWKCVWWGGGGGEREIRIIRIHFHHQNDSCIKIGSDVSLFKVSLTERDKVHS